LQSDIAKVFKARSYSTVTKGMSVESPSRRIPDAAAVTTDDKVISIEVPSPSDVLLGRSTSPSLTNKAIINRNLKALLPLGGHSEGLIILNAPNEQTVQLLKLFF